MRGSFASERITWDGGRSKFASTSSKICWSSAFWDVLTVAERQLAKSLSPEKGRDLVKQVRNQLLELARPMLESIIYEVTGVKVLSMHHDISTVTGEEVVLFSLSEAPRFS